MKNKEIAEYAAKNKSILITKDLEFANRAIFPAGSHYGVIVLRLPTNFKAPQVISVLTDFLRSIDTKELEKAITIVKLGRYRIRKLD